jgi:glucose-6-phosphate isomerase
MEIDSKSKTPDIRWLSELKMVLYDQEWAKAAPDDLELYYMYRFLKEKDGLRYDITIIPPRMLGKEFTKTKGHHHQGFYGELYIVLEGEGIYLMQKGDENKIEDVCAVRAKKGEAVVIPAGYGHVTINPSGKELKTANWMSKDDKGNFNLFEKMHGACYFAIAQKSNIKNEKSKITWVKNTNYKEVPELRFEEPLKSPPDNLDFLKPQ